MKVIECNNLSKSYGKVNAINDLSLTIEENKITGLIGRNGAGKQLKITRPAITEIKLVRFDRDFTVRQFMSNKDNDNNHQRIIHFSHDSPPILNIKIPKNLQIDVDSDLIF